MKTTLELPDDLVTEVKIEAARQRKKLKELVPELVRAGLRSQRGGGAAESREAIRWLDEWVELGRQATSDLPSGPSATEVLHADRSRLDRR